MKKKHIGSSFDEFLESEGLVADVDAIASKKILAWQLSQGMQKLNINKVQMAQKMRTSRAVVDRLLDPINSSLTLKNLEKAAAVLNKMVRIELHDIT